MNKKKLNFILKKGEGQYIEFKEGLNNLNREIVAFANSSGGRIFLGVGDNNFIKGIKITNKLKSQIQDIARNCEPFIFVDLEEFENVLIIKVNEGENKPYSCKEGFYMRMGANSQKMKRDEILKLAIKGGKIRFDEQICKNFDWNDFDEEKFNYYLKLAGISRNLDREDILRNLNLLTEEGFANAGVLFFSKKPSKYIRTSKIRCVYFAGTERVDILDKKEVDRGIIGNIEFAINYLKDLVSVRFEIESSRRREYPEYPEKAYREAIINAIVHRDYFNGDEVAVEKLKDKIVVNNKGGLLFDEKDFGKKSEQRNRLIADLLSKTNYMEKVGTGINRIKNACKENGNKFEFDFKGEDFFVAIYSNKGNFRENEGITEGITEGINLVIKFIEDNPGKRIPYISSSLKIPSKTIERWVKELKEKNLIEFRDSNKIGGYYVK